MIIKSAEFVKSCVKIADCPNNLPEYAFIGRSNVGKSSLINALANRKKLAKISSKPGKTRTINYFIVNNEWHLVDLPGYGFAQVSKKDREFFEKIIKKYIFQSPGMMVLFVLIDASIPPQKIDIDFVNNMGINQIPIALVFTKADKTSKTKVNNNIEDFKKQLLEVWETLPPVFVTSAKTKQGRTELLDYIDDVNKLYKKNDK